MKRALVIAALLLVASAALWRKSSHASKAPSLTEATESQTSQSLSAQSPTVKTAQPVAPGPSVVASDPKLELRTIEQFSDIVASAHEISSPASLVKELERAGLAPIGAKDFDEATGSMITLETKNTLPGSRYFRAQYFSDEQGVYQLQHMSFELKPGTPVDEVVRQLNRSLGPLPHVSYSDAEWKAWKLPGHYTLSIKKLNGEDVTETALHAYSPSDVGTLRVALEADLPGHDNEPL